MTRENSCPTCNSEHVDYIICAEKQGNLVWHCECKVCHYRWDELKLVRPNFTASIDSKGRITIRSDVRESLGIKAGDKVRVIEMEKVMTIEGLQKARMNSKKLASVMMNPRPSTWGKTIEFIVAVRKFIIANPDEVCTIAVKNKKKWEKILLEHGIPRDRFEFVEFPKQESQIIEAILDEVKAI